MTGGVFGKFLNGMHNFSCETLERGVKLMYAYKLKNKHFRKFQSKYDMFEDIEHSDERNFRQIKTYICLGKLKIRWCFEKSYEKYMIAMYL